MLIFALLIFFLLLVTGIKKPKKNNQGKGRLTLARRVRGFSPWLLAGSSQPLRRHNVVAEVCDRGDSLRQKQREKSEEEAGKSCNDTPPRLYFNKVPPENPRMCGSMDQVSILEIHSEQWRPGLLCVYLWQTCVPMCISAHVCVSVWWSEFSIECLSLSPYFFFIILIFFFF